jgi:hypothetical protein
VRVEGGPVAQHGEAPGGGGGDGASVGMRAQDGDDAARQVPSSPRLA